MSAPAMTAPEPLTHDELRDFFWNAIMESMDVDWSAETGAAYIMREIEELGATDTLRSALAGWGQ